MVSVVFPKPTGYPQLLLNDKHAYVMDPHVEKKVLVHVKKGPETICGSTTRTSTSIDGVWSIKLTGKTCFVTLSDNHHHATWRYELLPDDTYSPFIVNLSGQVRYKGIPGSSAIALGLCFVMFLVISFQQGFTPTKDDVLSSKLEQLVFWVDALAKQDSRSVEFYALKTRIDLLTLEQKKMTDILTKAKPKVDFAGCSPNPDTGAIECTPMKEELKPLYAPPTLTPCGSTTTTSKSIPDDAKLLPGDRMNDGNVLVNGEYTLHLSSCRLFVTKNKKTILTIIDPILRGFECVLSQQYDGNLVLYRTGGQVIWSSRDTKIDISKTGFYLSDKGTLEKI